MSSVVVLSVVKERLNTRLCEAPRSRIEWLFLRPHNVLRVRIRIEIVLQLLPGEGVQLLEARDRNIVELVLGAVVRKRRVHLASAEDHARDLVARFDFAGLMSGIFDDPLEMRVVGELVNAGACDWMA